MNVRELVSAIEYAGNFGTLRTCPRCGGLDPSFGQRLPERDYGHREGCEVAAFLASKRKPVAHLVIPGAPQGKKNSPQIAYTGISSFRLQVPKKSGGTRLVVGLKDFLWYLHAAIRASRSREVLNLLTRGASQIHGRPMPSADFRRWDRTAKAAVKARADLALPVIPAGHLITINALFYLAPRQRPDLPSLLQAVCDSLEDAGVFSNDYFVNGFARSRRIWPPAGGSKAAKAARAAHQPRTEIWIYDDGKK